jgi:hypothetical protein
MPLTGTAPILGAAIKAAVDQVPAEAERGVDRDALFNAMASAILTHITANAVVVGTSVSGGPVTGTVT